MTQRVLRNVASIIQHLLDIRVARIGSTEELDDSETWLRQTVHPRYFGKICFYYVLPFIQHDWQNHKFSPLTIDWRQVGYEINDIITNAEVVAEQLTAPVTSNNESIADLNCKNTVLSQLATNRNIENSSIPPAQPQQIPFHVLTAFYTQYNLTFFYLGQRC
ncbi:hypothetical protein OO184_15455 [Photorhabdus sp. APURE]|uniref:hypothetical protein n=1 Tax=Photorhabdus aballayi TaxID=2991723 RepID=UPI00223DC966|nr:hypothetical protein [Photorhabdus aballayi]MCW7549289.1 hypothetical protein [Photorhabdus aballayi]